MATRRASAKASTDPSLATSPRVSAPPAATAPGELDAHDVAMKNRWARGIPNDRILMLQKMPFIGSLAMQMDIIPVVDDKIPTACTDGKSIWVNPHYLEQMSMVQRHRVLAHEVMHPVMSHFQRRGNRDPKDWNIAADCEINRLIKADFLSRHHGPARDKLGAELMEFGCWGEQVFGKGKTVDHVEWSAIEGEPAERLYELIHAQRMKNGGKGSGNKNGKGNGKGDGDGGDDGQLPGNEEGHRWSPSSGEGRPESRTRTVDGTPKSDPAFAMATEDGTTRHQWNQRLLQAASRHERTHGRGSIPGEWSSLISNLTVSKVPWTDKLSRFIDATAGSSAIDMSRLNRRMVPLGYFMPSRRGAHLELNIGIDSSGSCIDEQGKFLGAVQSIVESFPAYTLRVFQADAAIADAEVFDKDTPFDATTYRSKGGGGTAFAPLLKHINENPELNGNGRTPLLYFTDLEGDSPPPPDYPVLWCKVRSGAPSVTWGEHLQIDSN